MVHIYLAGWHQNDFSRLPDRNMAETFSTFLGHSTRGAMVSLSTLNRVDRQILWALASADDWQTTSLFKLAIDLGLDYSHAWASVTLLEDLGMIDVQRGRGRGMVISLRPLYINRNTKNFPPQRGIATNDAAYGVYRTQGESMDDLNLDGLRSMLEDPAKNDYPRPEISKEEEERYGKVARKINSIQDQRMRLIYVAALIGENVRLLREVNEHRQARGYQPLPAYDPDQR